MNWHVSVRGIILPTVVHEPSQKDTKELEILLTLRKEFFFSFVFLSLSPLHTYVLHRITEAL